MTGQERALPPDPEGTDSDEVTATTPAGSSVRVARRFYFSETIQRDGAGLELHEVVSVEEELPAVGELPDASPDRLARPYAWERYWRAIMRSAAPPNERWQARWPWDVGQRWTCAACGRLIDEVQAKGRPPHYCQRPECQRARARARQRRHRNGA